MTLFLPEKIVLASSNVGKLKEFEHLFNGLNTKVILQDDFNIKGAEEAGATFVENAILKARHASACSDLPALADDSGLSVGALNGQPGIFSARYAGDNASDIENVNKLLDAMSGLDKLNRVATFHCVLVYMAHAYDPTPFICHGRWQGFILEAPKGENGFGYDSIFYVPDMQCSSAELTHATKNKISHRAKAMAHLKQYFFM